MMCKQIPKARPKHKGLQLLNPETGGIWGICRQNVFSNHFLARINNLGIVFLVFSINAFCQKNLILNSSFEDILECPSALNHAQVRLAPDWFETIKKSIGGPVLFNRCAGSKYGTFGVPLNSSDCHQNPRTGDGFAGLVNYYTTPLTTEYLETKLARRLTQGHTYFIQFFVAPPNCLQTKKCRSDGVGLAFSENPYAEDLIFGAEQIPPYTPAIQNPDGNILKDTSNWIEISGCYTAKGNEAYVLIGNFKSSARTQSQGCVGVTASSLFIDDIGIFEYDPLPDTILLCKGESRLVGQSFLNASYYWNTGETDSTITIDKGGTYIVNTMLTNCILSDTTIVLEMESLQHALLTDTFLCKEESLLLNIPIPGNYIWSNGSISNRLETNQSGLYSVEIENKCGVFSHSFEVVFEICDCTVYVPNH